MEQIVNDLNKNKIAQEKAEKSVKDFLATYSFSITFPLNFITLAEKMGGFKIYYMSDKNEFYNKSVGAIVPLAKQIILHPRFNKDEWSFFLGRYILAKLFARYALGYAVQGKVWLEMNNDFRPKEDMETNENVANFAFELLMPKEEFSRQWNLLGRDIKKLSNYFGTPEFKITERILFLGLYNEQKAK